MDYAGSGFSICAAMKDHFKRFPDKRQRPDYILWEGQHVKTSDHFSVALQGVVRAEILSAQPHTRQGFDLKLHDGWVQLEKGERVNHLRTWNDAAYENSVEYPYFCVEGRMFFWNVYETLFANGHRREEMWTGNSGMWVELISPIERIYHCSHGGANPPDFESLVVKVTISPGSRSHT